MNKKILMVGMICLSGLLTACGLREYLTPYEQTATGTAADRDGGNRMDSAASQPAAESAVMGENVSGSGIHAADNVSKEQQTSSYWTDRMTIADRVILTEDEIDKKNQEIKQKLTADNGAEFYDLNSFGDEITGERLKEMIARASLSFKPYYCGGKRVHSQAWEKYALNCAYENIPDIVAVRSGIVSMRSDLRLLPTEDVITEKEGETADLLQNTALSVNEPVLVLHESNDGKWFYVVAEEYAGWVKKGTVALCRNRVEWQKASCPEKFLVVTADRIQTRKINGVSLSGDFDFTMGTKLALAENKEWEGMGEAYDCYVVKVPVRDEDGMLSYSMITIPLSYDVTVGYMEYTGANVIKQAFKMLGDPYGWGGTNGERDCSSFVRDLYLCFGLRLPRNSGDMKKLSDEEISDMTGATIEEKIEQLKSTRPGTIFVMPGHVGIYLGCAEQNYYVISARGGVEGRVMVNDLHAVTEDGKTWAEQLLTFVMPGK